MADGRAYAFSVPSDYMSTNKIYPVVLFIHGWGGEPVSSDYSAYGMMKNSTDNGYISLWVWAD